MECKLVNPQDEGRIKQLWSYCFEKQDHPFFKYYFSHIYNYRNVLAAYDDDTLLGCLHLNPYEIYLRGQIWPISYVVGVGTFPHARNKGIAKAMLINAFSEMRSRGHFISLLMPFRAQFYYPAGYTLCYRYNEYEITLTDLKAMSQSWGNFYEAHEEDIEDLSAVYKKYMHGRHAYVIRDKKRWKLWIKAHQAEQGNIYLLRSGKKTQGYVVYYVLDNMLFVKELAYTSFEALQSIFSLLYSHYSQVDKLVWQAPIDECTPIYFLPDPKRCVHMIPHMMGRIIDVPRVLSRIFSNCKNVNGLLLKVEDEYAAWNHQTFRMEVSDYGVKILPLGDHVYDISCSIGALTQLVFGERTVHDLVFTGAVRGEQEAIALLGRNFPRCVNYFLEEF